MIRKNFMDPAYMKRVHKMDPVDLVAHGDTGCYTMLMFPPTDRSRQSNQVPFSTSPWWLLAVAGPTTLAIASCSRE